MVSDGINSAWGLRVATNVTGQRLIAWEQERGDRSEIASPPTFGSEP
jgi:hypothetical protein